ncbi:MAG: hypothetical protein KJ985_00410 [Proteobacteria bacterium]|nr:hypothetical protein [Pseudomonadota bacterium]
MRRWILLCLSFFVVPAHAVLNIEITGAGEHQTPVSLVRFAGDAATAQGLLDIVGSDLIRTGLFKLVDPAGKTPHEPRDIRPSEWVGVEAVLIGSIQSMDDGKVAVKFRLLDLVRNAELLSQVVTAKEDQVRAIGHRIADMVYERFLSVVSDGGYINDVIGSWGLWSAVSSYGCWWQCRSC